jgi:hypothetical protein
MQLSLFSHSISIGLFVYWIIISAKKISQWNGYFIFFLFRIFYFFINWAECFFHMILIDLLESSSAMFLVSFFIHVL